MGYVARDVENSEPDDWTRVKNADSSEEAAELFAERQCSRNVSWPSSMEVEVKNDDEEITRWNVEIESRPTFIARRAK